MKYRTGTFLRLILALLLTLFLPFEAFAGQLEKGRVAYDHHDYQTAINLWLPLAKNGDPKAQYNIGYLYYTGNDGNSHPDFIQAMKWWRKAADQENVKAQCYIGDMYGAGVGVAKDDSEAAKWYRKAGGYLRACNDYRGKDLYPEKPRLPIIQ